MPNRIPRNDFVRSLQGTSLEVKTAEADARLRSVLPGNADLNGDGTISDAAELDRLFTQIDSFGRTPDSQSVALTGPDGRGTQAAAAMRALGELTRNAEVLGWTEGIDLTARTDFSTYVAPAGSFGDADAMVGAAALMLREHKDNYGTHQPWFNLDPNHALPAGKALGGLGKTERNPNGVWKCNLFGGNAMHAAGFAPPYYGNKGSGEYPNANQFYKFSDKYAAQYNNKVHFQMVGELGLEGLDGDAKKAALIELLRQAQPGDLLMVDHLGTDVSDGGHTRVVMANELKEDGTGSIHSAQATQSEGAIRAESLSSFSHEEHVWILRPNKQRAGAPTPGVAEKAVAAPPKPVTPAPVTPAPTPGVGGTYTVKPGDTLSKIAAATLGSAGKWRELLAANPEIQDANKIRPGMTLKLPA